MFITSEDFDLIPYNIPHKEVENTFAEYIIAKEEEALRCLLGDELFELMKEAYEASLVDGADPLAEEWVNLINGISYNYKGKDYKYKGLKKLLIPYVYSQWLLDTFDTHSNNGIVIAKNENSGYVNPSRRIAIAYNDFARQAGGYCVYNNTLYGFLKSNFEVYPTWKGTDPKRMNTFGL